MTVKKWLLKGFVQYALVFMLIYLIGSGLGIMPQSVKDSAAWLGDNFTSLASVFCFCLGCYVFLQFLTYRKGSASANRP